MNVEAHRCRRRPGFGMISAIVPGMSCLSKSLRRRLSAWLVLAILFTQVATAAYVCPMAAPAGQREGSSAMVGMPCAQMMSGAGVKALDPAQPGLCMHHCMDASQTFDPAHTPSVPAPAPLPSLAVRLPERSDPSDLQAWSAHRRSRERAPPLPHSLDHCCFRI